MALFNIKNLKTIMTSDLSHICKIEQPITILLHPIFYGKLEEGIKTELDSLVNKYSKEFNGILLGYESVKVCKNVGLVFDTFPFIHIDIQAKFYIFCPNVGDTVEGIVVKKSPHHVGCLVHGLFNISCFFPTDAKKEEWIGNTVKEEDKLVIQIMYTDMKSIVPYFKGKIESISVKNPPLTLNTKKVFEDDEDEINSSGQTSSAKELNKHSMKIKASPKVYNGDAGDNINLTLVTSEDNANIAKLKKAKKIKTNNRKVSEESYELDSTNNELFTNSAKKSSKKNKKSHEKCSDEYNDYDSASQLNYSGMAENKNGATESKKSKKSKLINNVKVKFEHSDSELNHANSLNDDFNSEPINIQTKVKKHKNKTNKETLSIKSEITTDYSEKYYCESEDNDFINSSFLKKKKRKRNLGNESILNSFDDCLDKKHITVKDEPISSAHEDSDEFSIKKSRKKNKIKCQP